MVEDKKRKRRWGGREESPNLCRALGECIHVAVLAPTACTHQNGGRSQNSPYLLKAPLHAQSIPKKFRWVFSMVSLAAVQRARQEVRSGSRARKKNGSALTTEDWAPTLRTSWLEVCPAVFAQQRMALHLHTKKKMPKTPSLESGSNKVRVSEPSHEDNWALQISMLNFGQLGFCCTVSHKTSDMTKMQVPSWNAMLCVCQEKPSLKGPSEQRPESKHTSPTQRRTFLPSEGGWVKTSLRHRVSMRQLRPSWVPHTSLSEHPVEARLATLAQESVQPPDGSNCGLHTS